MKKKNNLMKGLLTLSVLGLISSSALAASAALAASSQSASDSNTVSSGITMDWNKNKREKPTPLTDAQKKEMETNRAAVEAALNAGDYNAWVTAMKTFDANSTLLSEVTSSNFSSFVAKHKQMIANRAERDTKEKAISAALEAGSYDTWVTAVKAMDSQSPILEKITSSNFSRYAEAYKLKAQSDTIMTELGLGRGMDSFGPGRGDDFGGMMGKGRHGFEAADGSEAADSSNTADSSNN